MTATPAANILDDFVYTSDLSPTATVSRNDEEFVVDVDAPGFYVNELEVELIHRSLHVAGDAPARENLLRPNFEFWFSLPARADERSIAAVFEDGVLTIRAALEVSCEERWIEIETR